MEDHGATGRMPRCKTCYTGRSPSRALRRRCRRADSSGDRRLVREEAPATVIPGRSPDRVRPGGPSADPRRCTDCPRSGPPAVPIGDGVVVEVDLEPRLAGGPRSSAERADSPSTCTSSSLAAVSRTACDELGRRLRDIQSCVRPGVRSHPSHPGRRGAGVAAVGLGQITASCPLPEAPGRTSPSTTVATPMPATSTVWSIATLRCSTRSAPSSSSSRSRCSD